MSDETLKVLLVVGGWSLETLGIVLIAAAELIPRLRRFGLRMFERGRVLATKIRGWLGPQRGVTVYAKAGGVMAGATTGAKGVVSVSESASVDRKIEFLLDRVQILTDRVDNLEGNVRELPRRWASDLDANRADLEAGFLTALHASRNEYISARLLGLPLVIAGATMLAVSSFV